MVCPPATSETGARRPRSISNIGLLCQTRKTPTLEYLDLREEMRRVSSLEIYVNLKMFAIQK
jgi:hypothetical protein